MDTPPDPPDPAKPFLSITQPLPASFEAAGGQAALRFSTNEAWSITVEPASEEKGEQADVAALPGASVDAAAPPVKTRPVPVATPEDSEAVPAWYAITPLSGDADEEIEITVTVEPNAEYADRGITLVLHAGDALEERIEITQLNKNAIIVGDNRQKITSEEQTLTIAVQSNVAYRVVVKQGGEWIGKAPDSRAGGLKEEAHRFTIAANPLLEERTGIVVFQSSDSDLADEVTIVQAAREDPDPERTALKAIYGAAGGGAWTHNENWCSDKPLGEWYGLRADNEGHVTALRLPKNNLTGTISEQISKLTSLRHLDLSRNDLEGTISTGYGTVRTMYLDNLTELDTIDLSHNRITGQFMPIDGRKLPHLKFLNLSFNQFVAHPFPLTWECMFENGRSVDLILHNNCLYGEIPDFVQNSPQWGRLALQCIRQSYEPYGGVSYTKDIRLPDFTFTDLRDGSQGSIREVYSGNTRTMVLAWDPTQEESRTFMENTVRRFHTLFGGQGFAVVAITPEGEEYKQAAEAYLRQHDMPYPVVTNYADDTGRRLILPTEPYPSYFLVDQYGTVTNDTFTGQFCEGSLSSEEPSRFDLAERPFQHADNFNRLFETIFGNSTYHSTDFSMDKKYETLQRATKGKGIDIVLIGEAYTDVDIATGYYKQAMEFAMEAFFAIEPTKSYREYFNVHMIYAVSRDAHISKIGGSTALGVEPQDYDWFYISTAMYYLRDYYQVVPHGNYIPTVGVVINGANGGVTALEHYMIHPNYAFTGFPYGGRRRFREVFIHETVGHGFGGLGDEYTRSEPSYQGEIPESKKNKIKSAHNKGWFLNLSLTDDPKSAYWSHLIGHPQYPYVGIYQGGYSYLKGVWRSESYSLMNHESDYYFNTICRELIVKSTLKWAEEEYTFEKFLDKDSDEGRKGKSLTPALRQIQSREHRHQPPVIGESIN